MRKLTLSMAVFALMVPSEALACPHGSASSISVACENGVQVYRGTPMGQSAVHVTVQNSPMSDKLNEQRLALQNERLAAQSERINGLESQLEDATRPARRSRYGRRYYAPIGAFGGGRGFGSRGYGGRGFGGHQTSGINVTYNRRRL